MTPTIAEMRKISQEAERAEIVSAMERNDWRLTYAAMDLGVGNSTLQKLIASHGLGDTYKNKVLARREIRQKNRSKK